MLESNKVETFILEISKDGAKQVEYTYEELETLKKNHWNQITDIRKATQDSENRKNISNAERHGERLEILKKLDESIPEEMKMLEDRILELMDIEQADELHFQFGKFKEMCDSILKKKKDLIVEFSKELDYKDQLYVDSLKKFRVDIQDMISLMRNQFITLRERMLEHLTQLENKFKEVRKNLLNDYKDKMGQLITQLNMVEHDKEKELTKLEDDLERKCEKDAYRAELEFINKIIVMEKHSNYMKETIEDFNFEVKILLERLEYRVEVRDEKIKENEEKKTQYDKWDMRLRERIQESMKTYKEKDLENRIKNSQLKEELMKMTESYDALKEKFQHFEKYDDLRFKDIYDMKSKEAKELALKVALAERTIKTQQLGMEIINNDNPEGFSLEELQKEQDLEGEESIDEKSNVSEEKKTSLQNALDKLPHERIKQVFGFIIQEAEFLIEMETIDLCENLPFEEKLPKYIESICKALSINNDVELNQLLNLFDKHNQAEKEEIRITEDSNSESLDEGNNKIKQGNGNSLIIDPDAILELLKEFFNEKKIKSKEQSNQLTLLINFSDWKY